VPSRPAENRPANISDAQLVFSLKTQVGTTKHISCNDSSEILLSLKRKGKPEAVYKKCGADGDETSPPAAH
jgi:hypothetical protein